jgi:nicotinamide-nucleotide amidase
MDASSQYEAARATLDQAKAGGFTIATAESCTGGLIAATLASVPGASAALERGFVTYTNQAKIEMLSVDADLIAAKGAVSREVALAMAEGALAHSPADISVAVTGIAGPGGGTAAKPVGLVHLAAARRGGAVLHEEQRFGDLGRHEIQFKTVIAALDLIKRLI